MRFCKLRCDQEFPPQDRKADVVVLFPDLSQAGYAAYRSYGPPRDAVIGMFYAGMTRAREALHLADRASTMAAHLVA